MSIYTIFYETIDGEKGKESPVCWSTNRDKMIEIAKQMKAMKHLYKKVELRRDIYRYVESDYIEV